jgi:hypothetical protein
MVKSFASTVVLLNATSTIFSGWIRVRTGSALTATGGAIQKNVREQNGMGAFYKSIDTILWGRKTCDMALNFQKKG